MFYEFPQFRFRKSGILLFSIFNHNLFCVPFCFLTAWFNISNSQTVVIVWIIKYFWKKKLDLKPRLHLSVSYRSMFRKKTSLEKFTEKINHEESRFQKFTKQNWNCTKKRFFCFWCTSSRSEIHWTWTFVSSYYLHLVEMYFS